MTPGAGFPRCAAAVDVAGACAGLVDDLYDGLVLPAVYLLVDGRLRCQATRGYFQVSDFTPWHGVVGRCVAEGRPVVLQDVGADEGYIAARPDLRAEACFPVRLGGRVVGAVNVESAQRLDEAALARAERAAAVLEQRLHELGGLPAVSLPERLARVAVTLTSATTVGEVQAHAVDAARSVAGAAGAAVASQDAAGRWCVEHADGPLAAVLRRWDDDVLRFLGGWVWAGAGSSFPDGEAVPDGYRFLAGQVRALWVHPLVTAGEVTGLLLTADDARRPHDPAVGAGLELLASLSAGALTVVRTMDRLRDDALRDPLTGLTNRRGLVEALAARSPEDAGALVLLDLDGFKAVNDRFGHGAGDDVLRAVAGGLREATTPDDLVCRLGGDEFAVLVRDAVSDQAPSVAERLVDAAAAAGTSPGRWSVGASAGVRLMMHGAPDALLPDADAALMAAKRAGGGRSRVWDDDLRRQRSASSALGEDLDAALAGEGDGLALGFQPVVQLDSSRVVGVEALLRWQHPVRGLVPAAEVVTLAEETGRMPRLTRWVLHTALAAVAGWPSDVPIQVGVNVSATCLAEQSLTDDVASALAAAGVPPERVVLEMTETAQVGNLERAGRALHALSDLGVRLALDDFGTGFSSLTHVHALPFDVLKIDRSFVGAALTDARAGATVEAVCVLADRLGVDVVAEGIEHRRQVCELRRLGCGFGQGWSYARALAAPDIARELAEHPGGWVLEPSP